MESLSDRTICRLFEYLRNKGWSEKIPGKIIRDGCVSKEFLRKYSKGKTLYANVIFTPSGFDIPKPLSDFISYSKCVPCKYPPQSYYYVNERDI